MTRRRRSRLRALASPATGPAALIGALALLAAGPLAAAGPSPLPAAVAPAATPDAPAARALADLQRAVLRDDRDAVARLVAFPLTINRPRERLTVPDAATFLREYAAWVTPPVRRALLDQRLEAAGTSAEGLRVGRGEWWLGPRCPGGRPACDVPAWRVIAINQGRPAGGAAMVLPDGRAAGTAVDAALPAVPPATPLVVPSAAPPTADIAAVPTAPPPAPPVAASSGPPAAPAAAVVASPPPPPMNAASPSTPAASPALREALAGIVNRVWKVRRSNGVAPGTLYTFLADGTLVIASAGGPPGLGRWQFDGDRLTLVEMGRPYPVEVTVLRREALSIRVRGPGEPVEIDFEPAAR